LNTLAAVNGKKAAFKSLGDTWADSTTSHGRSMLTVFGGLADDAERVIMRSVVAGVLSQLGSDGGALRIIPGHGGG